jgi:hypothetical protein
MLVSLRDGFPNGEKRKRGFALEAHFDGASFLIGVSVGATAGLGTGQDESLAAAGGNYYWYVVRGVASIAKKEESETT